MKKTDFDVVVNDTINYWLGKKNNPLNGKSFTEIYNLSKKLGKENIK